MGDSLRAIQHEARSTRKTRPWAQAAVRPYFAIKVSKGRRACRRLLMDCTLWGCIQVVYSDFRWIVKLGWYFKAYTSPCAFFGVLRTYYRHRRFAKCLTALSEVNPQKPTFGCKQLSGWLLLSRYQKAGVHAAGFWWIILFEDVSKLSSLIFDGL